MSAPATSVAWLDVSQTSADIAPEDHARYLARFHAWERNGQLPGGAAAFVALWCAAIGSDWQRFGCGRDPGPQTLT